MRRYRKKNKFLLITILVLCISIGYALLSSSLSILGIGGIKNGTWDIHWKDDSVEVSSGSVTSATPVVSGTNDDTVTFSTTLELPGDYFEFTVDAINEGSVDGMIDEINTTITDSNGDPVEFEDYINFSVTYNDGTPIRVNQILGAGKTEKYKLRLEFDSEATEIPENDITYNVSYQVTYIQPDPNKIMPVRYAKFDTGTNVIKKFKLLAGDTLQSTYPQSTSDNNITSIEKTTTAPVDGTTTDIVSVEGSIPIYAWFNNGTIYWYTEAEDVFLNEDASYMFNNLKTVTNIDTSFDTRLTTNMGNMFSGSNIPSADLSNFNTSEVTNMSSMFSGSGFINLDLSNWDIRNVTSIGGMFGGCNKLKTLDVSNWNFAKITSLSGFVAGNNSIETINFNNVNTSNINSLSGMFSGCSKIKSLDLSSFDVSNVTNVYMFGGNYDLKSIDIHGWNFASTTSLNGFFAAGITGLERVNLEGVNTSKITNMNGMFNGCSKIRELDLSSFDTSQVTDMSNMFNGMTSLVTIVVSDNFVVNNVTNSNNMFNGATKLMGGNGTSYDSNYIDKTYAHYDYGESNPGYFNKANANFYIVKFNANGGNSNPSVKRVYQGDRVGTLPVAERTGYAFEGWYTSINGGTQINQNYIPQKNVTIYARWSKIEAIFDIGQNVNTKLKTLAGNTFTTDRPYYEDDTNVIAIRRSNEEPTSANKTTEHIISSPNSAVPIYAWFDNGTIYWWSEAGVEYLNEDASYMFNNYKALETIDTSFDTSLVNTMYYMFALDINLQSIDVSGFNTSNVIDFRYMFEDCRSITELDLSNFDTSNATEMNGMMGNMDSLEEVNIDNFNFSKYVPEYLVMHNLLWSSPVKKLSVENAIFNGNMQQAFAGLYSIEEISLKNSDTSNVYNMSKMFYMLHTVKTIDLTGIDTSNARTMEYMFWECYNLEEITNIEGFNTSNVVTFERMFYDCRELTELDLSNWDTRKVANMAYMLAHCKELSELNLSNWDFDLYYASGSGYAQHNLISEMLYSGSSKLKVLKVDNVKFPVSMDRMFYGLDKLETLSLNNVNTSNVTDMTQVFEDCKKIKVLNLSSFNTTNVTSMKQMFSGMTDLTTIIVNNNFVTTGVTDSTNMFRNSSNIVGGVGTVWDENHIDKEYARIDAVNTPGYFTTQSSLNNLGSSFATAVKDVFNF